MPWLATSSRPWTHLALTRRRTRPIRGVVAAAGRSLGNYLVGLGRVGLLEEPVRFCTPWTEALPDMVVCGEARSCDTSVGADVKASVLTSRSSREASQAGSPVPSCDLAEPDRKPIPAGQELIVACRNPLAAGVSVPEQVLRAA